ncbi:MAG: ferritin-like domain-containing protein [Pseudomonadota bacterium]
MEVMAMREGSPGEVPFDPISTAALIDACCHILGNTCRIARMALTYQWNAVGLGALQAEASFRDQADELHGALTPIAEHVRALGGVAILDYSDTTVTAAPPGFADLPALAEMLRILTDCHREAGLSIEAAIDIAEESADRPSIALLTERLAAHRRHARRTLMLRSDAEPPVLKPGEHQTLRVNR